MGLINLVLWYRSLKLIGIKEGKSERGVKRKSKKRDWGKGLGGKKER